MIKPTRAKHTREGRTTGESCCDVYTVCCFDTIELVVIVTPLTWKYFLQFGPKDGPSLFCIRHGFAGCTANLESGPGSKLGLTSNSVAQPKISEKTRAFQYNLTITESQ